MDRAILRGLEDQCIQECAPPCATACPVHVDVRAMLAAIGRGEVSSALDIFRRSVPFPGIISRICDQPCQDVCNYGEIGNTIAIRALERACVEQGDPTAEKPRPRPQRSERVAIVGGGISGMTAAHDLARKGYAVTIFEAGDRLGGSLWKADRDYLPADVIEADLAVITDLGVDIRLGAAIDRDMSLLRHEFDAVYVAVGPRGDATPGLARDEHGVVAVDPVTFATSVDGVFAGGGLLWGAEMHSSITSISEGRRAGISIDRYLQEVSLTASRSGEGPHESCLYTDLEGIEARPQIEMHHPDDGYEWYEALLEAQRCIQCECMECVKVCEYLEEYDRYPRRYVREVYNNLSIVKGTRHANRFINSCSLCGLCAEVCPTNLDMGKVNLEARRTMVTQDRMPPSAHDFALRDMQFSNSDKFAMARNRPGAGTSDYVLFPGCQLSGSSPHQVEQIYGYLTDKLDGRDVGMLLGCCGAPANWAGREDLYDATVSEWRRQLEAMGNPTVVLPCSSCHQSFKTSMPDVEIVSLWEVLDEHGPPDGVTADGRPLAVHDPCTTRHESHIHDSVRSIIGKLGFQVEELARNREQTTCCSYGGHMWLANRDLSKKVLKRRIDESATDFVTYCAMCRDFFAAEGKRTVHVLDLIFGEDLEERTTRRSPGYSQRHENRAHLKRHLLKEIWGEDMDDQAPFESIELIVADDVAALLEDRLILTDDVRRVIEHAERTGRRLRNPQGRLLAYHRPTSVTYWVEYLPEGEAFRVFNAYSHRMEIPGGGSA